MRNVLEFLENVVQHNGNKTAVEDIGNRITYAELHQRARKAGSFLHSYVKIGDPIAVYAEKSVNTIVCMLGIVYAGAFYSVVDVKHPKERVKSILDTLDAKVILVEEKKKQRFKDMGIDITVLSIEEVLEGNIDEKVLSEIRANVIDTDPLYANFTSGSTGIPKGVVVSHRSVIDFIQYFTQLCGITSKDVIGNQAPLDFDVSVKDIYSALLTGATVELIPPIYFSFPNKLMEFLAERKVTTLIWAVSALCIVTTLRALELCRPKFLNKIMFSGEMMPIKHLNIWRKYYPQAVFINLYGPTEITCNCSYYIVDREFAGGEILPIGKPFPNERILLLDENDQLITEEEQEGEICVIGTALALGYYNSQSVTSQNFVQNPLHNRYPELMYRTGDMGKYHNKELYFVGRKDFQIKLMGHRIELNEIEAVIALAEGVDRVCCVFEEEKIWAFLKGNAEVENGLRKVMQERLPKYMWPSELIWVDEMPLNKNGKIDRKLMMQQYRTTH